MSRRNLNHKMLDAISIAATQTSSKSNIDSVDQAVIVVDWSGTSPIGVITVEASNSSDNDFKTSSEVWEVVDFGSAINVTGNTGSHQLVFNTLPFKWIRFIYTRSSGTGTITAHLNAASLGA